MQIELSIRKAFSIMLKEFIGYKLREIEDDEIVKGIRILLGVKS
jgi:hypothetical protein